MKKFSLFSAKELISKQVQDAMGNDFGEVRDIFIDNADQRVKYLVISQGGLMGTEFGSNYKAVPLKSVEVNPNTNMVMFNLGKDFIENSPDIDFDNFENKQKEISRQLALYYGESAEETLDEKVKKDAGNDPYYSGDRHLGHEGYEKTD